jgi:hypothetical protein
LPDLLSLRDPDNKLSGPPREVKTRAIRFVEGVMVGLLLALLPPEMLFIWPIGFLIVLLADRYLVIAMRTREKRGERARRVGLALVAVLCGPLVGVSLACSFHTLGNVHPLNVAYTYVVFTVTGGIAGLLAGSIFGIIGLLCPRDRSGKDKQGKPVGVTDEL